MTAECIKTKMVSFAGVSNKVKNYYGFSNNFLEEFAKDKNNKIDFLFVDHVKELYKQDVELAVNLGLLQKGSVVVADNVLYPGSPEYRKWMLANPRFKTEVKLTYIEYSNTIRDEITGVIQTIVILNGILVAADFFFDIEIFDIH
eukprot:Pgem_evm1s4273